eukprot:SM000057S18374  [mRNA]  locus=s57:180693:183992:- [translate_table: standard]
MARWPAAAAAAAVAAACGARHRAGKAAAASASSLRRGVCGGGGGGRLVREYIQDRLYDERHGYFAAQPAVVGTLPASIDFPSLAGREEYQALLRRLYAERDSAWLTPVEVFQPWYGNALAEYILRQHEESTAPLKIFEIGAGSGTCAVNILDYIKERSPPGIYESMTYTAVEISAGLADLQLRRVHRGMPSHAGRFHVRQHGAQDVLAWGPSDDTPCFVIMLEVLDNLPHDRIVRQGPIGPWLETYLVEMPAPQDKDVIGGPAPTDSLPSLADCSEQGVRLQEMLRPFTDPLLAQCLAVLDKPSQGSAAGSLATLARRWMGQLLSKEEVRWIPTGCMELLRALHTVHPNMTLIAADFDFLPDVVIAEHGAPLVASKVKGVTTDHTTYIVPESQVDIFFPTDFTALEQLDHSCAAATTADRTDAGRPPCSRASATVSTAGMMQRYGDIKRTCTRSGFNPLLDDYRNTQFYISVPLLPR